jgi:hypothetical protein
MINPNKRTNLSKIPPEIIQEIKDKRKQGMVINILCYTYNLSPKTLNKILKS